MKIEVSDRALMARINRKLAKEGQKLKKTQPTSKWASELGEFYIVDEKLNTIDATHVDLEKLASELSVLKAGERIGEAAKKSSTKLSVDLSSRDSAIASADTLVEEFSEDVALGFTERLLEGLSAKGGLTEKDKVKIDGLLAAARKHLAELEKNEK